MSKTIILNQAAMSHIYAFSKANKMSSMKVINLVMGVGLYTNTSVNAVAAKLIQDFTKANKVSNAKVTDLVEQITAAQAIERVISKPVVGKTASEAKRDLRKQIITNINKMDHVTIKDVAAMFGAEEMDARATINYLEKNNMFARVGLKDKEPGVRGKKEILWSAVK